MHDDHNMHEPCAEARLEFSKHKAGFAAAINFIKEIAMLVGATDQDTL